MIEGLLQRLEVREEDRVLSSFQSIRRAREAIPNHWVQGLLNVGASHLGE